jgi:hypothetical protein
VNIFRNGRIICVNCECFSQFLTAKVKNGAFVLSVPKFPATISVNYLGYTPAEAVVNDSIPVTVSLVENTDFLDEVVVVGYGTQRRKELTGAIAGDALPLVNQLRQRAGLDALTTLTQAGLENEWYLELFFSF